MSHSAKQLRHHPISYAQALFFNYRYKTTCGTICQSHSSLKTAPSNPSHLAWQLARPPETLSQPYRRCPDCNRNKQPVILLVLHKTVSCTLPLTKSDSTLQRRSVPLSPRSCSITVIALACIIDLSQNGRIQAASLIFQNRFPANAEPTSRCETESPTRSPHRLVGRASALAALLVCHR